jgi:hypothetical protein
MIIERNKKEIVIRIKAKTNVDELQEIADYIRYKELAQSSKASQQQVDNLVKKVKKGRWKKTKAKLAL